MRTAPSSTVAEPPFVRVGKRFALIQRYSVRSAVPLSATACATVTQRSCASSMRATM